MSRTKTKATIDKAWLALSQVANKSGPDAEEFLERAHGQAMNEERKHRLTPVFPVNTCARFWVLRAVLESVREDVTLFDSAFLPRSTYWAIAARGAIRRSGLSGALQSVTLAGVTKEHLLEKRIVESGNE